MSADRDRFRTLDGHGKAQLDCPCKIAPRCWQTRAAAFARRGLKNLLSGTKSCIAPQTRQAKRPETTKREMYVRMQDMYPIAVLDRSYLSN